MKFDCGETFEEKRQRLEQWHPKFAWLPIRVTDHDCRWLEYVERRITLNPINYWLAVGMYSTEYKAK